MVARADEGVGLWVSLIHYRDRRQANSVVVNDLTTEGITPILRKNIAKEAKLMTNETA